MRTVFFLLFLLVNNGPASAYSCEPPELGLGGCNPKYFTLPQMEDTIHGIKGITEEGKALILEGILKRAKSQYFTLNLRIFSKELCQEGLEQGIDLFENGRCSVGVLSYSLYPGSEIDKVSGSLEVDINIGKGGGFDGATVRGILNF